MRVVIIDDEQDSQYLLASYFRSEGYDVWSADDSAAGLELVRKGQPDLIVLDVRLPGVSGEVVCRRIRAFSEVPVLMVSAYARDNEDIIRGLNAGADDYLPKPIDFDLLKARVGALLRRSRQVEWREGRPAYIDPYLTVDLYHEQAQVNGQPLALSPMEYRLLALLVRHTGQTIPSLEIVEKLWPAADPENYIRHVHTYVRRLRKAIEPNPKKPIYILTEHGLGYRFVPRTA